MGSFNPHEILARQCWYMAHRSHSHGEGENVGWW